MFDLGSGRESFAPRFLERTMYRFLILSLVLVLSGCGGAEEVQLLDLSRPLSVETWKGLEVSQKYELETLELLRESDPEIKTEKDWKRFMKEVVVPERQKDIPTEY